jgi:hypothetical protein
MIKIDDLMSGIMRYGRGNMQDLVARTTSMSDVINYIQAERYLEFTHLISYVTTDMIDFKKKSDVIATPIQEPSPD